jgi:Branched-chain amino acid transport system / permease component
VTGFAGVMLASRMSLGDPKTSVGLELGVISACVLGGVSLTGGVATISGVLVGVLIMGSVQDARNLLNVPTFYQYLIRGGICCWRCGSTSSGAASACIEGIAGYPFFLRFSRRRAADVDCHPHRLFSVHCRG